MGDKSPKAKNKAKKQDTADKNQKTAAAKQALRPGGILAIWSAGPDPAFARRLAQAGFSVDEVAVRARQNGKGPRHVIWFARKRTAA